MPITKIFCEGGENSPDIRVLRKVLPPTCEIRPSGGKYGMGDRIKVWRELRNAPGRSSYPDNTRKNIDPIITCCGILDRDFCESWENPKDEPIRWEVKDNDNRIFLGWKWERKEIENYLIDPVVVRQALGEKSPDITSYESALSNARDKIAIYQAARIALTCSRIRFVPLASLFGKACGKENHLFPDDFDEVSCRKEIIETVRKNQENRIIDENDVLKKFKSFKDECTKGGQRFTNFLHAFSGKDLLLALNEWLSGNGFESAFSFRAKIVRGIQQSTTDVFTWLPEWEKLRFLISNYE